MADLFNNAHALFIGVGNDLPITVNDATALKNVFVDPSKAAYNPNHVQLLTEGNASKEGIIKGFDKIISESDEESTVVIYYSGHGTHTQSGETFLLVPHNYTASNPDTWLIDDEFNSKISSIKAKKLIVLLDACHSAGMAKSTPSPDSSDTAIANISNRIRSFTTKLGEGSGRAIISSCTDNQKSWILPNNDNSIFTLALMEALHGKHPHDEADKFVNLLQVIDYVFKQVPARVKTIQQDQKPFVNRIENMVDGFPLCFLPEGIRKDMPIPGHDKSADLLKLEKDGLEQNVALLINKITFMQNQQSILSDPAQQFTVQQQLLQLTNRRAEWNRRIEALNSLMI